MTIVVSVRVNDGIVLASDSATSFVDDTGSVVKIYNNANKIFNLVKGCPIGAMTYGAGSIGSASISTLSKDLRVKFSGADAEYALDRNAYTVEEVANKVEQFLDACYHAAYPDPVPNYFMGYRVCGYSTGAPLPEAWAVTLREAGATDPVRLYDTDSFGPRWAGETEAIDRLILGVGSRAHEAFLQMGAENEEQANNIVNDLIARLRAQLYLPAMPIQDAIDLAFFLASTAAQFAQFSLRPATVGGPIEIATITKHEGFKWVNRKHYYSVEFNRKDDDHAA